MHELGVSKQIIKDALAACLENNITAEEVVVEIGELTTFKEEPLQYYFKLLRAEHDELKDANLNVQMRKGKVQCNQCQEKSEIGDALLLLCKKCSSMDITIIEGNDVIIKNIKGKK